MKKEDITNRLLFCILGSINTQNTIMVEANMDKIKNIKEIKRLIDSDSQVERMIMELFDHE